MLMIAATLVLAIPQSTDSTLYRVELLRAAPGHFNEVLEVYTDPGRVDPRRFVMRHSQGDHWDFLVLEAATSVDLIESSPERREIDRLLAPHVIWNQVTYFYGPPLPDIQEGWAGSNLLHIEMFVALNGKSSELLEQRYMENRYSQAVDRPTNAVFRRHTGAEWDVMTIGFYRDLVHFSEPNQFSPEEQNRAAIAAGFESRSDIGPYLRSLITYHNDTLASAVRSETASR